MREVFELQDHITAKVVSSVAPTIERAEIDRVKQRPTNTTDAYDTYLRGVALYNLKQAGEARNLFKKAAAQYPEYAAAYAMSAHTYSMEKSITGSQFLRPKCKPIAFATQTQPLPSQVRMLLSFASAVTRSRTSANNLIEERSWPNVQSL